jgi:uncharacterized protein (DUF58 family)
MTYCAIQNWSRLRLAIGCGWVLTAFTLALVLTGSGPIAVVVAVAVIVLESIVVNSFVAMALRTVDASLEIRGRGGSHAVYFGRDLVVGVRLRARRSIGRVAVTLVHASGIELLNPSAGIVNLRRDKEVVLRWRVRPERPGSFVFAGAAVRKAGLFMLMAKLRFCPDRIVLTVLPDYCATEHTLLRLLLLRSRQTSDPARLKRKGMGSDFRELREYRYPDPISRVDWKATARRRELIVRDYEAPREFSIRVFLDASADMTARSDRNDFARALAMIGKLGAIAGRQGVRVSVWAYDSDVVVRCTSQSGTRGFIRFLTQLSALPYQNLIRQATMLDDPCRLAANVFGRLKRGRLVFGKDWRSFAASYVAAAPDQCRSTFIVDFGEDLLVAHRERCPGCRVTLLADECACPRCGHETGVEGLPARAASLRSLLTRAMRDRHDREVFILISSLRGGEVSEPIACTLAAAARTRHVHVVLPTAATLRDARPIHMRGFGDHPSRLEAHRNVEKLRTAIAFSAFRERLVASGIEVHPLENARALDDLVLYLVLHDLAAA